MWNLYVRYRIYKSPPSVPILTQLCSVHDPYPTSWGSILVISSHLFYFFLLVSFLHISPSKSCIQTSTPTYLLHTQHLPLFYMIFLMLLDEGITRLTNKPWAVITDLKYIFANRTFNSLGDWRWRKAEGWCAEVRVEWRKLHVQKLETKVKFTLEQAMKAQRGSRGTLCSFFNLGTRWGGWSTPRPGRTLPPGKTRYPSCRRLGGPQVPGPRTYSTKKINE